MKTEYPSIPPLKSYPELSKKIGNSFIVTLLLSWLVFYIINFVLGLLVTWIANKASGGNSLHSAFLIQLLFSSFIIFLFPATLTGAYYLRTTGDRVFTLGPPRSNKILWSSLLLIAMVAPISIALSNLTLMIPFPDELAPLRDTMMKIEQNIESLLLIAYHQSFFSRTILCIAVVIVAPIAEEYFFRGALQGYMIRKTDKLHLSIWITAFIFSLIHFQFIGFLSRIVLGATFGYLAVYGSLRFAMMGHMLWNLLAFLSISVFPDYAGSVESGPELSFLWSVILLVAATVGFIFALRRLRMRNESEEIVTNS